MTIDDSYSKQLYAVAMKLHGRGLWVAWCEDGKDCRLREYQSRRRHLCELFQALLWDTHLNLAIVLNQSPFVDVECDSVAAENALQAMFDGEIPPTPTWQSKRGKHRLFLRPEKMVNKAVRKVAGIEFRGLSTVKGAISVVPPSAGRHWLPGLSLFDLEPAALPEHIAACLRNQPVTLTLPDDRVTTVSAEEWRSIFIADHLCRRLEMSLDDLKQLTFQLSDNQPK